MRICSLGISVSVVLITLALTSYAWGADPAQKKAPYEFQKGMCYATWSKDRFSSTASDASLKEIAQTGAKWVAIVPTWYQDKCYTTKVFANESTASDESVIHAIDTAHALGMKVMIKPHLDIVDISEGSWRGEIACINEPDWKAWFESYRDFMVHYAQIAQANNVEMLCIGTELTSVSTIRGEMWKDIVIKPVREAYKGPLTYAANWNVEYMHVSFWDAMDYVGIDAYFPLSDKDNPTLEELKKGWEPWVKEMEDFQKKINMPIIFPEVGYISADGAAKMPWEDLPGKANMELQANCYRALLETFWGKEWFYGMYWWRWGTDVRFGGPGNRGFTPQNKPAKKIVVQWYKKPAHRKERF